ncbi:MAG: hypothetical protein ABJA67_18570 [Chthonomonadales bacterium]
MMQGKRDIFAQVMGFLVFLTGVGVILTVLFLALEMFRDEKLGIKTTSGPTISATDLGVGFGVLILKIALLFLGSISGSLIANKGIQLYFTGAGRPNMLSRATDVIVETPEEVAVSSSVPKTAHLS